MMKRLSLMLLCLLLGGLVSAHATLVFGSLSSSPEHPQAGEPFTLRLELSDPAQVPIEDAYVVAEFRRGAESSSVTLEEGDLLGVYQETVTLEEAGAYTLVLRDQTFRQEEATAELQVTLGEGPLFPDGSDTIALPPTATGANSLRT